MLGWEPTCSLTSGDCIANGGLVTLSRLKPLVRGLVVQIVNRRTNPNVPNPAYAANKVAFVMCGLNLFRELRWRERSLIILESVYANFVVFPASNDYHSDRTEASLTELPESHSDEILSTRSVAHNTRPGG